MRTIKIYSFADNLKLRLAERIKEIELFAVSSTAAGPMDFRKRIYVKSLAHYRCFSWSRPCVYRSGA
jgi:hypothetical protein